MSMGRIRRIVRRTRTARRHWGSAALAGAGRMAYGIGRKAYKAVRSYQRSRDVVRAASHAISRYQKTKSIGASLFGGAGVTGGDYSQFTEKRIVTGYKPKNTLKRVVKELHQKGETAIFRFSGINPGITGNGLYWASKNTNGTTTSMPLYLFDLTSITNIVNNSVQTGTPFLRAQVTDATGVLGWQVASGTTANGFNVGGGYTSGWLVEKTPAANDSQTYPFEKSQLMWSDVRLVLYGAKQKAIKWTISLVQFTDIALDPLEYSNTTGSTPEYFKHNVFWQNFLKTRTYSPIATTGAGHQRGMKVLKSYTHIIQPTSSTENDVNPHFKILKIFSKWYRMLNYHERGAMLTSSAALYGDTDWAQASAQQSNVVKPRNRIYLLIAANDYSTADNVDSVNDTGSFDMSIRTCHLPN